MKIRTASIPRLELIRRFLIFLLPACLFLAAYPQITIGSTESMNLEISIPEIWLVLFSVASLSNLPKLLLKNPLKNLQFPKIFKFLNSPRRLFLWTAIFPLYATVSLLWSANLLRGFLTVGLLWLLWFSIWNVVLTLKSADDLYRQKLQTVFLTTSAIFAGVCWLQCLLDIFGAPAETSLLCKGCISASFGFPHPNGLTLEPQFMGNLLLAPTFFSLNLFLKKHNKKYLALFAFFSATLFLTFSRGAIYAFGVAFIARIGIELYQNRTAAKNKFGSPLLTIPTIILAFIFTLSMQGVFAELGPTDTNFVSATTSSIHQLSLGKIDLRPTPKTTSETSQPSAPAASDQAPANSSQNSSTPVFSGYVEESTNVRADLTNKALDIWNNSPENAIFGTGFGSAGTELYKNFPEEMGTSKEIVQNEYASILLELGIVGYLFLFLTLLPFIKKLSSLELSYLLTLFFFSGLPNAFHVYLFPPLLRTKLIKTSPCN